MSIGETEVTRQLIGNPDFAPLVPREEDRAFPDRAYPFGPAILDRPDGSTLLRLAQSDAEPWTPAEGLEALSPDQLRDLLLNYFTDADDDLRLPGISDDAIRARERAWDELQSIRHSLFRTADDKIGLLGAAMVHAQQKKYQPDQPVIATGHKKQDAGLEVINRRIAETNVRTWVALQSQVDLSISAFRLMGFQAGILDGEVLIEPVLRNKAGEFGVMPLDHFPTTTRIYRGMYDSVTDYS